MPNKVILITGASSGIGYDAAIKLADKGYTVYGAARRMDKLKELESKGVNIISLDVTDEESMISCVNTILDKEGTIDILVNNAGYGSYGAIEDVPIEEARRQLDVNIFGLARMTQLVLPSMRDNKSGRIINISSMGGKIHTPLGGWYHVSKHALEVFSDCLRMEVTPFNIDVVVVEPGGIFTDWGVIAAQTLRESSKGGAYTGLSDKVADNLHNMYSTGNRLSKAGLIGDVIIKAVIAKKPKTRYVKGTGAIPAIILKRLLPDRVYDWLIMKVLA